MAAYGDTGSLGEYEYDHFVPLELGGATNDPRNLWPEPGASPNPKDTVENELRQKVCDGRITLAQAQREIVTNWVRLAQPSSPAPSGPTATSAPAQGAECTLISSYSHSGPWHTDSSGYADVYFKSGGTASGRRITGRVRHANCSTTL